MEGGKSIGRTHLVRKWLCKLFGKAHRAIVKGKG